MPSSSTLSAPMAFIPFASTDIAKRVKENGVYKERSHEHHLHGWGKPEAREPSHVSEIEARLSASNKGDVRIILLGSSGIERLKTTARTSALSTRPDSLNLGVGGDKIESVLYRISLGLFNLVQQLPIKLWVIHIGSNNLKGKYPLSPKEVAQMQLLLDAALAASSPDAKILLCAIFEKKGVKAGTVADSNTLLLQMKERINAREGRERVFWEGQPKEIDLSVHLADAAHLNFVGYQIWERALSRRIGELLGEKVEEVSGPASGSGAKSATDALSKLKLSGGPRSDVGGASQPTLGGGAPKASGVSKPVLNLASQNDFPILG